MVEQNFSLTLVVSGYGMDDLEPRLSGVRRLISPGGNSLVGGIPVYAFVF